MPNVPSSMPSIRCPRRVALLTTLLALTLLVPARQSAAQGTQATHAGQAGQAAGTRAAPRPRTRGSGAAPRRPATRPSMTATDAANRRLAYRLVGTLLQRSLDDGRHWTAILNPVAPRNARTVGCQPQRYRAVDALAVAGIWPGALFLSTAGDPGRAARARRDYGCGAATGGLYALRPDGRGRVTQPDPLAAGLPYAQDARARTPRAYALRDLVSDPTNPTLFYTDAAIPARAPAGRGSPRAGLYRSLDGGHSWQPAMNGLPTSGASGGGGHTTLFVNPAHGAIVFAVVGTALYRSTVHGGVWVPVRAVHATRGLALSINPFNPQLVYALTDRGFYHSRDGGLTWSLFSDKRLAAAGPLRAIGFDRRAPSVVLAYPASGRPLRLAEFHAPAVPRFDPALTLTPQVYDRVTLALHGAPFTRARLVVTRGANPTSGSLTTNGAGFGYATVRLDGRVAPTSLRVRVEIGRSATTLTPLLSPGYTPGQPPPPPATPTPIATASPTASPTLTPTASPTVTSIPAATAFPVPTAYPASPLDATWQWIPLTSTLPLCGAPVTAAPSATLTPTTTASPSPSPSPSPTAAVQTGTPATTVAPLIPTATVSPSPSPSPSPAATATTTPVPLCTGPAPAPRQDYAAAWDNADHKLFVFGGTDYKTSQAYNDISAYSTITGSWTTITPVNAPPPGRYGAGAAWDPSLGAFLVFGGMHGAGPYAGFYGDVWAYTPATNAWTNLSAGGVAGATAPSARAHAAVTWDATHNQLLVFGGQTDDNIRSTLTNDLWAFSPTAAGGSWSALAAGGGDQSNPPARQWAQIAWDTGAGALRLFGGKNPGLGAMSDSWTWSQANGWTFEPVTAQPPGRQAAGYAWDDTHGRFIVGPGGAMAGDSPDVWEYENDTTGWRQVPIANPASLPLREQERMVWDAADNEALLFGGRQPGAIDSNDLWALVPTGQPGPAATAAPAPGQVNKGVDLGQTVRGGNNKVILTDARVQEVASSGVKFARLSFYIGDNQTTWSDARLHAYEQVISKLSQKGIGVLALASNGIAGGHGAGDWVQNAQETTGGNGYNQAIGDYVAQLHLLVSHFHAFGVTRWEIWNEPNVPLSNCSIDTNIACLQQPSLQPSNFAQLLAQSYGVIKGDGAVSDVQLVSGGIFGHSIAGAYTSINSGAAYLTHTYDEGVNHGIWSAGTHPLDAVGEHIYVDQGQRTTPAVIHTYLDWFRAAYAASDPGKGTVLTEVGWRTGDTNEPQVTPGIQAANLDTAFATARQAGYVQDLSWFELQDEPGYLNNTSWGLIDRGGNSKAAFGEFQKQ